MKKKVLALALATAVLLTACGGQETANEAPVEEATEEVVEEAEETASDYTKGISSETGYESEWLGIRFTAPEGAAMLTEEELNEMMGLGQEVLSEDFSDLQLQYAEMSTVSEMMCTAAEGTPNVVMSVEKMMADATAADYAEVLAQTLGQVTTMTYTIDSSDEVVTIGGKDFVKVAASVEYEGVSMKQNYYVMVQGDRAVSIALTFTPETEDAAEAMMNGFEAY